MGMKKKGWERKDKTGKGRGEEGVSLLPADASPSHAARVLLHCLLGEVVLASGHGNHDPLCRCANTVYI